MGIWGYLKDTGKSAWGHLKSGDVSGLYHDSTRLSPLYQHFHQGPADEERKAFQDTADSLDKLGADQRNYYQGVGDRAIGFYNSAIDAAHQQAVNRPTQQQTYFDYMGGLVGKNTNLEDLYSARKGGNDPAAAYEDQRATTAINNQLAARGGFNSGAGLRNVQDYYANVGAQRSKQLADLAAAADASRLGLSSAYGGAASGASGEQRDYYRDLVGNQTKLANDVSNVYTNEYNKGGEAYGQSQYEKIQALLKKAGVDVQQTAGEKQSIMDLIKMYMGGAPGGGGGGNGGGGGSDYLG